MRHVLVAVTLLLFPGTTYAQVFLEPEAGYLFLEKRRLEEGLGLSRGDIETTPVLLFRAGFRLQGELSPNVGVAYSEPTDGLRLWSGTVGLQKGWVFDRLTPYLSAGIGFIRFKAVDDPPVTDLLVGAGTGMRYQVGSRLHLTVEHQANVHFCKEMEIEEGVTPANAACLEEETLLHQQTLVGLRLML